MKLLPELKYVESHEWVRVEENKAYVGITDYAQEQLGDIVYVEVPEAVSYTHLDVYKRQILKRSKDG